MTFSFFEKSIQSNRPDELFFFTRGSTSWNYTSGQNSITHLARQFDPIAIKRTDIVQTSELNRSALTITVPRDAGVVLPFIGFPPSDVVLLQIFRRQRLDVIDNEFITVYKGRVINVEWKSSTAEMTCESVFTSMRRIGVSRHYQANCAHVLYGNQCKVNQLAFKASDVAGVLNGFNLTVVIAGTFADGYFAGGQIDVLLSSGDFDRRMIKSHVGTTLTLVAPIAGINVGDPVDLFPGCKHNLDDCLNKFANIDNYGGFPYTPPFSPFGGTILY